MRQGKINQELYFLWYVLPFKKPQKVKKNNEAEGKSETKCYRCDIWVVFMAFLTSLLLP